ncbi:MAG: TrkA C-terminal domain-containing protein [Symbiobacteriia bacterium]
MATHERGAGTPRYEQIARDLADRISRGDYREGEKIFGRSTLAGTYQVSPETIRRAIALLHSRGVLAAEAGRGVTITSVSNAQKFLEEFHVRERLDELQEKVASLFDQRRKLDTEIEETLREVLTHTSKSISAVQNLTDFVIQPASALVGRTIGAAQIRMRTGATIIAVAKDGEDIYSPGPDLALAAGDVLVAVGTTEAKEKLKSLVNASQD